jgi:hypothetical protein
LKITEILKEHATNVQGFVLGLEGGSSRLARPVMRASAKLARPAFEVEICDGIQLAATWLVRNYHSGNEACPTRLVSAVHELRSPPL